MNVYSRGFGNHFSDYIQFRISTAVGVDPISTRRKRPRITTGSIDGSKGSVTGVRRTELCHLKVEDIDSTRMIIHIRHGKRNRDRDVPLSPKLLETLREYWRWMQPKTYLFRARETVGERISPSPQSALGGLAGKRRKRPGIAKDVRPHLLRQDLNSK